MRAIEIDIEVHKSIEAARTNFTQTDNDILRTLLRIEGPSVKLTRTSGQRPWKGFNRKKQRQIEIAHGTPILADYSGQDVPAVIDDGAFLVNSKRYTKPSPALIENVTTKAGGRTQLNGWREWKALVGGKWVRLTDL